MGQSISQYNMYDKSEQFNIGSFKPLKATTVGKKEVEITEVE